ncbi:MAG: hypothetical protein IPG43_24530 [Proteobacteria bacterium]|nr:hypothetical protein [Pseudomonadota bacterium]
MANGFSLFSFAFLAIDVMAAFTELLTTGVLERHPRLKVTVLESGANWISAWLDRLDHKFEVMRSRTSLSAEAQRVYFKRQCTVSADPDETITARWCHVGAQSSYGRRTARASTPRWAWCQNA